MKKLKNHTIIAVLCGSIIMSILAFQHTPPALATVSKGAQGYVYSNINKGMVNTKISNGLLSLSKIDFHYVDNQFYLVRQVKTKNDKIGYLFSEVKRVKNKLYPIEKVELFWPCWQVASCQCDRPSAYAQCVCTAGASSGCVQDWGGPGFENLFEWIYN